MKNLSISIALVFLALFVQVVHADDPFTKVYVSQHSDIMPSSPPLENWVPFKWYQNAGLGGAYTEVRWWTDDTDQTVSFFEEALGKWDDVSPAHTKFKRSFSANDVDLEYSSNTGCPSGGLACFHDDNWYFDSQRNIFTVKKGSVRFPGSAFFTQNEQKLVLRHEVGHVFGLADRYDTYNNGATILCFSTSSQGYPTMMDHPIECNSVEEPTVQDENALADYYLGCDGLYTWCGVWAAWGTPNIQGNYDVHANWFNYAWTTYMGRVSYYYRAPWENHWSHAKDVFHIDRNGYWDGATPQSSVKYTPHTETSLSGYVYSYWYVRVCSRPWFTWGAEGVQRCQNQVQVP